MSQHEVTATHIFRLVLSVVLPPLGVFLSVGLCSRFWINLLLTLLGYLPGLVHAVWVIARAPEDRFRSARYA